MEKKKWEEFRDSGLLWWINMILHTFGWAIVVNVEKGEVKEAYPARVPFRGFGEFDNSQGYVKVSKYLHKNSAKILEEAQNE